MFLFGCLLAVDSHSPQAQELAWAKRARGTSTDNASALAVDGSGNTYVTGFFFGTATFGPGEGNETMLTSAAGSNDIFVAKIANSVVPFDVFVVEEARVDLDDDEVNDDRFEVEGFFTAATPIDPLTEDIIVVFDGFSATVPAGSCVQNGDEFKCNHTLSAGGRLRVEFDAQGEYRVRARKITLTGIDLSSPVPFSLQIGDDSGETTIDFDGDDEFEALNQWLPGFGPWLARLQHLITPWQDALAVGRGQTNTDVYDR